MVDAPKGVKVPVFEVAAESYNQVFGRLGLMLELGWIPFLILLAAALVPDLMPGLLPSTDAGGLTLSLPQLLEALIALFCLNAFAVRWHQIVLYPRQDAVPPGLFRRAATRFVLYSLVIYLVSLALLAATLLSGLAALPQVPSDPPSVQATLILGGVSLVAVAFWLSTARLALLFPAAAYGRPLGFGDAWRMMRRNSWRLMLCGFVACVPLLLGLALLLTGLLAAVHFDLDNPAADLPFGFVLLRDLMATMANFIIVALGASILSGFYRRIVLGEPSARPRQ